MASIQMKWNSIKLIGTAIRSFKVLWQFLIFNLSSSDPLSALRIAVTGLSYSYYRRNSIAYVVLHENVWSSTIVVIEKTICNEIKLSY